MIKRTFYRSWWFITIVIILLVIFYADYKIDKCKLTQLECIVECGSYQSPSISQVFECKQECIKIGTNCIYQISPFNRGDYIE
jgi:hypothetical protein